MELLKYQSKKIFFKYSPFVSIIVPNYNHEAYLRRRLDSIYEQTYQNFEVILMDDCSQDNSKKILDEYHSKYRKNTRTLYNTSKAKNVSEQWRKGMLEAKGELVWIAESDDYCTLNFIEALVPYFENSATMLSYCNTINMNGEGTEQIGSIQRYLCDLSKVHWNRPFLQTAAACTKESFSIKNIVPNVSGALLRKPENDFLNRKEWRNFRFCGDWLFYLDLIRGGLIAYSIDATNFFRIHDSNNTQLGFSKAIFYKEHEEVCLFIKQRYDVPSKNFEIMNGVCKDLWIKYYIPENIPRGYEFCSNILSSSSRIINNRYSRLALYWYFEKALKTRYAKFFNLERIQEVSSKRQPNLLLIECEGAGLNHQSFSVILANALKKKGYGITFLRLKRIQGKKNTQSALRSDIPVIYGIDKSSEIISDFMIDVVHFCVSSVETSCLMPIIEEKHYKIRKTGKEREVLYMLEAVNKSTAKKMLTIVTDNLPGSGEEKQSNNKQQKINSNLASQFDQVVYSQRQATETIVRRYHKIYRGIISPKFL